MRILGVDFGDRHIGLAVSDALLITAQPFATFVLKDVDADNRKYFRGLVRSQDIGEIVVGLPLRMDGSDGTRAEKTRAFAAWLKETVSLPVHFWDERLSTRQAAGIVREQKVRQKARKSVINQISAAIILQSFLDRRRTDALGTQDS
jgi:putative Holliday junction resolvase